MPQDLVCRLHGHPVIGAVSLLLVAVASGTSVAQPDAGAARDRLVFVRDGQLWAVSPQAPEAASVLRVPEPVGAFAPSHDGRYAACTMADDGGLRIYRVLPGDEFVEVDRLLPGLVHIMATEWSPSGEYLAIRTNPRLRGQALGGEPRPVPHPTPDDARLGVRGVALTKPAVHLLPWLASETLGERVVEPMWGGEMAWAPDSRTLAFLRESEGERWDPDVRPAQGPRTICILHVESGVAADIPATGGLGIYEPWGLAWSADSAAIAYCDHAANGLLLVPADGGEPPSVLDDGNQYTLEPRWSPDGRYLAFARSWGPPTGVASPMAVWVLDLGSHKAVRLTNEEARISDGSLSWSPDGSLLAFHAGNGQGLGEGGDDLYVADPRSGEITRVAVRCDMWPYVAGTGLGGLGSGPVQWLPASADEAR